MSSASSVAATLPVEIRKQIGLQALTKSVSITQIASDHQVSRKYVYAQESLVETALNETFAPATDDNDVLFYLPVTKTWVFQLILGLVLICHCSYRGVVELFRDVFCSYRGVVELFRDVFDIAISIGTVHNRLKSAATTAAEINQSQDLSPTKVGLLDEMFQGSQPVLTGVDAFSTYCYLLKAVEHRDEDTWGCHLLDVEAQGFKPDYTIADGGKGLRAGQKAAMPDIPCHGDVFHILQQFEELANSLAQQSQGATTQRLKLEEKLAKARLTGEVTRAMTAKLAHTNRKEGKLVDLAKDVKTLLQWMSHDILELAGPPLAVRQELFDFIKIELQQREDDKFPMIRKLWKALHNQCHDLLAFAGVLDQKLFEISERLDIPLFKVRQVCLLHRKNPDSNPYWERWNQLHQGLSGKFYGLMEAVGEALKQTPRASSMVENLNSRLRNYFFLRRSLGDSYLELLQFFLNHRRFMRSDVPERVGKSPKELLTGEEQPHWLELLGFELFQKA